MTQTFEGKDSGLPYTTLEPTFGRFSVEALNGVFTRGPKPYTLTRILAAISRTAEKVGFEGIVDGRLPPKTESFVSSA